jgi:hypothetical protein
MNQQFTVGDLMERFIGGIHMIAVPRIEDLPYWTSPPIQFVYEATAALILGQYTFTGALGGLAIPRPIISNSIYFFRNVTLSADIAEGDYLGAILSTPQFQIYKQSEAGISLFREPIRMSNYFQQFDYRLVWQTQSGTDQLFGSIVGVLNQTAGLIGKASVTIKAVIAAQEIIDEKFTRLFREHSYPETVS